MELYTEEDIKIINENIDTIVNEIEEKKLQIFEPTRTQIDEIVNIVLDFIKSKKRKIYGGTAQNKLIEVKNPLDAFYGENNIPDIDFYSPDPIQDLIELSNILHEKGIPGVISSEAIHQNTYKIFANFYNAADLSYTPRNIYHKIPFIEIDGIVYTHPSFMMIDLYKMLTDPYFSSFRWKKVLPRIMKLQKYYPFKQPTRSIPDIYKIDKDIKPEHDMLLDFVYDFIKNKDTIIVYGQYAYNCYVSESKLTNYDYINIPFYEIISTNYLQDASELILSLKDKFPNLSDDINYVEFYPLWTLTGFSVIIYFKKNPLVFITSHNNRCMSTKVIIARQFKDKQEIINEDSSIQVGSFNVILLMNMIMAFRARVFEEKEQSNFYNLLISYLIKIRNEYLGKNNLTILDDSMFEEFSSNCVGSTSDPIRDARLRKIKKGRIFQYNPTKSREVSPYVFPNTSGNIITNPRNLKVTKYIDRITKGTSEEPSLDPEPEDSTE